MDSSYKAFQWEGTNPLTINCGTLLVSKPKPASSYDGFFRPIFMENQRLAVF
ncbi:hypothetical protein [Massilioclostridium coli]|uniref:hypothetical protein n=1 Tax=Massilioclostridium coli TaxID=1870991 RepID=UPI001356341D|nr:hypothetical protein [Massilioclostridium coli]